LHFLLPEGVQPGEERQIEVALSDAARSRYPDSEVRYRRAYSSAATVSSRSRIPTAPAPAPASPTEVVTQSGSGKRRPAVSEPSSSDRPYVGSSGGWRRSEEPPASADAKVESDKVEKNKSEPSQEQPQRGWRRVKPGEQP
jgi:hypothetical protein